MAEHYTEEQEGAVYVYRVAPRNDKLVAMVNKERIVILLDTRYIASDTRGDLALISVSGVRMSTAVGEVVLYMLPRPQAVGQEFTRASRLRYYVGSDTPPDEERIIYNLRSVAARL